MLLIDFFETTPISSLVPINSLKPNRVVFLIDNENLSSHRSDHIRKAVNSLGCVKEFSYQNTTMTNISAIQKTLSAIIGRQKSEETIYIDLTGGSERMVAAGYAAAMESTRDGREVIPIYSDITNNSVYRVDTNEIIGPVQHIDANGYFLAIGAKKYGDSHHGPKEEERDRICEMAEVLFDRTPEWHALSDAIAKEVSETGNVKGFRMPSQLQDHPKAAFNPKELIGEFEKRGFVEHVEGDRYRFPNDRYREYMTTFGIWLEMYIYLKGKDYFDEAYLGMLIDWNVDDNYDSEDNEIDVVFVKDSIPYFISCKMRRIEAQDIYEIGFVAHHFGGKYAKRYIATSYPLDSRKPGPRSLRMKMKNMDVGLINTNEVREKGLMEVLFPEDGETP